LNHDDITLQMPSGVMRQKRSHMELNQVSWEGVE